MTNNNGKDKRRRQMATTTMTGTESNDDNDSEDSNDNPRKRGINSAERGGKLVKVIATALSTFNSKEKMDLLRKKEEQASKLIDLVNEKVELEKQKHTVTLDTLELDKKGKL